MEKQNIVIEKRLGITIVRDDLLVGGTKSILLPSLLSNKPHINEFVYASPVYGGFQIALSAYCESIGKRATIFCAKRNTMHANTLLCLKYGAEIVEVPYGYLTVVEKKAREYCFTREASHKIVFGGKSADAISILASRVKEVLRQLETQPDQIWCAVGSGTLVQGILEGCSPDINVVGVQVGSAMKISDPSLRNLTLLQYPLSFEKTSKLKVGFPCMPNYDLKALEMCLEQGKGNVLFWNVM